MPSIDDSKCVLVTGATAGIGRALALGISQLPSHPKVIATGRRQDRLQELAKSGLGTIEINFDTNKETLKVFVADLLAKHPDLDSVVLCAGIQHEFDFKKEVDLDNIISEVNINYTSVVSVIALLLPHFLKLSAQGRPSYIIPVTSGLGVVPGPWVPNYSATKAALRSFSISLRAQLQGTNVHVLEIIPPLVESELHDPYGTTQRLSNFWMPLDEYTKITMEGLRKGDSHISAGMSETSFKRFDEGKEALAQDALKRRSDW